MELQKIVAAVDFSDASLLALETTFDLALENESTVYLVHVGTSRESHEPDLHAKLEERLNQLIPVNCPSQVETVILEGIPAKEVARFARENSVDLIVAGTHGRKGLSRILMGSTAEELLREAPCRVLVSKPHAKKETEEAEPALRSD